MGSNFDFLQERFPDLADLGQKAESYLYSDPNACLFKLRALGEQVVNLMLQFDHVDACTGYTQVQRIRYLRMEEYLPSGVADSLTALRVLGNKAVHGNYHSEDKAALCLKIAYGVCEWFMETYGDYRYTHRDFVMPERGHVWKAGPIIPTQTPEEKKLAEASEERAAAAPRVEKKDRVRKAQSVDYHRNISEEETRYLIDSELRQVGWEVDTQELTYAKGARPKRGVNQAIAEWPVKFGKDETRDKGSMDYALFAGLKLVGLIEAKRLSKRVNTVLDDQCADYASHVREEDRKYITGKWGKYEVPFLFATNGRPYIRQLATESGIWFRDARRPDAVPKALLGWMSPEDLTERLARDRAAETKKLESLGDTLLTDPQGLHLRPYQIEAVKAAENAVAQGKENLLLAMATGTGKTRVILAMMYRFLKSQRFHRILYLVDRNNLGQQAYDMFTSVKLEQGQTLDQIYDINPLDKSELSGSTRVQIATVQSMIRRLFGREEEETIPSVSAFDLIIVDEAHRGYVLDREMGEGELLYRDQADYQSKYRQVLDYFDAVKIGLTATPALQTTEIFGMPVYQYSYRQAVIDGYLVDYDAPIQIVTKQARDGIHISAGTKVTVLRPGMPAAVDTTTLADDVDYDVDDFNRKVVVPGFTRVVLQEISKDLDPSQPRLSGKTLLFAVNDRHADEIVQILKEIYGPQGVPAEAIVKITGTSFGGDRKKIQDAIKRFKNEEYPSMVVTVDLLSTGVDVPSISTLVFLRRVKSRILFEQMMGRATRPCPDTGKTKFTVYDCVGLFAHMEQVTNMKPVAVNPGATFRQLLEGLKTVTHIDDVRDHLDQVLVKLQRKWQHLPKEKQEQFLSAYEAEDVKEAVQKLKSLPPAQEKEAVLARKDLWQSLDEKGYSTTVVPVPVVGEPDTVVYRGRGFGKDGQQGPQDYLQEFTTFIRGHLNQVDALHILCTRPRDLTRKDLLTLRDTLSLEGYTEVQLNTALRELEGQKNMQDAAVDIITLVRRAALGSPLMSHEERIRRAVDKLLRAHSFTTVERNWLKQFENCLLHDDVFTHDTLDDDPRLKSKGGFRRADKAFGGQLDAVIDELNGYLYEDPKGGKLA